MKPEWMREKEKASSQIHRRFKHCMDCRQKGEPCGYTNYMGPGIGRLPMYRCKKHPSIQFYRDSLACTDYER